MFMVLQRWKLASVTESNFKLFSQHSRNFKVPNLKFVNKEEADRATGGPSAFLFLIPYLHDSAKRVARC